MLDKDCLFPKENQLNKIIKPQKHGFLGALNETWLIQ